jgi:hypothetical protein
MTLLEHPVLPVLMGIHPILDKLIAGALKKPRIKSEKDETP